VPVVDASVVVDWVAPDSDPHGPARRLLDQWAQDDAAVLAPRLLLEEVGNALLTGVRRERWTGAQADAAFGALLRLPVQLLDTRADVARAYELSRRYDEHPLYDMVYVAMTERLNDRLVTADRRLVERVALLPFVEALA
jgi:predicted nucleic acid-binding protein